MNRAWGLLKVVGWLFFAIVFLLLIVIPVATSLTVQYSGGLPAGTLKLLNHVEFYQRLLMQVFAALWFFVLGSCFASFLNVVAWRVPRGRSILGSSHCPHCDAKLSFRDNLPVVGWLRNQGQCRSCSAPISPRYLWVEVFLGTVFLLFAFATLYSGGATIPIRDTNSASGFERVLFDPKWDLIQIFGWQLTLILFLFTYALIELDSVATPISIFVVGLIVGIAGPLLMPCVHVVSFRWPFWAEFPLIRFSLEQVYFVVFGMVTGTTMALWHPDKESSKGLYLIFGLTLIGTFLGWQSAVLVSAYYMPIQKLLYKKPSGALLAATVFHLLTWRWFDLLTIAPN